MLHLFDFQLFEHRTGGGLAGHVGGLEATHGSPGTGHVQARHAIQALAQQGRILSALLEAIDGPTRGIKVTHHGQRRGHLDLFDVLTHLGVDPLDQANQLLGELVLGTRIVFRRHRLPHVAVLQADQHHLALAGRCGAGFLVVVTSQHAAQWGLQRAHAVMDLLFVEGLVNEAGGCGHAQFLRRTVQAEVDHEGRGAHAPGLEILLDRQGRSLLIQQLVEGDQRAGIGYHRIAGNLLATLQTNAAHLAAISQDLLHAAVETDLAASLEEGLNQRRGHSLGATLDVPGLEHRVGVEHHRQIGEGQHSGWHAEVQPIGSQHVLQLGVAEKLVQHFASRTEAVLHMVGAGRLEQLLAIGPTRLRQGHEAFHRDLLADQQESLDGLAFRREHALQQALDAGQTGRQGDVQFARHHQAVQIVLLDEPDLVHYPQLVEQLAHDEGLVLGAQATELMQGYLKLEVAAHEGSRAAARNIMSFQQQCFTTASLQCRGCSQPRVSGTNNHCIKMSHDITVLLNLGCKLKD